MARIAQLVHPQPVRLTEFHFSPLMQYRGEAENETVINSDDKLLSFIIMSPVAFKLSSSE